MNRYPNKILLRITPELYRWLEEDAIAYGRTITGTARWHLEQIMKENGQ